MMQTVYGNPTVEEKIIIETPCFTDAIFSKLKDYNFDANDSENVKSELNQLVGYTESMQEEQNLEYLKRYRVYDRNICQFINSFFKQKGINSEEICNSIISDIEGIILKLKYFYQRPRPFQLAQEKKLGLFPFKSFSSNSPSYPSKSAVEAIVILTILGNKFPQHFYFCQEMMEDISYSRCFMGVNLPSDIEFSKVVAKEILKLPEFSRKYQI